MRAIPLVAAVSLTGLGLAALPAAAQAHVCYCRVGYHHTAHRHVSYVRHTRYYRPYAYSYRTPVYYDDYAYDPYVYRSYYDWSYAPGVWVSYGPDYGWYGDRWRWRRHHHWRGDWAWEGRGRWHEGGHGHWDHGRHRGWG